MAIKKSEVYFLSLASQAVTLEANGLVLNLVTV